MVDLSLFVAVPRGLESLLAGELRGLGASHVKQVRAGATFTGSLQTAYRICLWSRLAGRVLLPLTTGPANDGEQLYETAGRIAWDEHLGIGDTLAVDFTGVSDTIRDTRYGAVRIKDAIVDQFRASHDGKRPSVDPHAPDVRVNAHLAAGRATISLDLSGDSLHRRGYRADRVQVEAPLKENLAAAVLLYAAWPAAASSGSSFLDPLCGSGTLPIEAALIAADVAPGLLRAETSDAPAGPPGTRKPAFGFTRWRGHNAAIWRDLVTEARERRSAGLRRLAAAKGVVIRGSDRDSGAVRVANDCVRRAGLSGIVTLERAELDEAVPPAAHGLLATNAPYGERLAGEADIEAIYRLLGTRLRAAFDGWNAAILSGSEQQAAAVGVAIKRQTELRNGPLTCTLAYYEIGAAAAIEAPRSPRAAVRSAASSAASREVAAAHAEASGPAADWGQATAGEAAPAGAAATGPAAAEPAAAGQPAAAATAAAGPTRRGMLGGGGEYLANRLRKNQRRLARRLQREGITCYRLYDADLPEYNLVIDVYGDWVNVQEYAAPPEIDPTKTQRRLAEALDVIGAVLRLPSERIVLKQRRRQRGAAQYERRSGERSLLPVKEDDLTFLVDLGSYLDTGFFIDQRMTRRLVRRLAGGRRFLNLFAYTGTMTVNALAAGAPLSTTVDMSTTYLDWARRNFAANGFEVSQPHTLIQADCLSWLAEADGQYDLIWLDPPTFSNSKRMGRATFSVERDHVDLIRMVARRLLAPSGILLFATNCRNFRLDHQNLGGLSIKDLSRATLAFDCERGASRHHLFRLERAPGA